MPDRRWVWGIALVGVAAAVGLLLPWGRSGGRERSSIELLSSANSLDLIEGWAQALLIMVWVVVVAGAAVGLLGVAWERETAARVGLAFVGPGLLIAVTVVAVSPVSLAWGAWLASGLGVVASIGSGLLSIAERPGWERRNR